MSAWTVDQSGLTVTAFVKARVNVAWSVAKRHVESGKVFVDGSVVTEVDHRLQRANEVRRLEQEAARHDLDGLSRPGQDLAVEVLDRHGMAR